MFTSCPHGSCARKLLKLAAYGRGNVKRFRLSSESMTKDSFHLDLPELYTHVFPFSPRSPTAHSCVTRSVTDRSGCGCCSSRRILSVRRRMAAACSCITKAKRELDAARVGEFPTLGRALADVYRFSAAGPGTQPWFGNRIKPHCLSAAISSGPTVDIVGRTRYQPRTRRVWGYNDGSDPLGRNCALLRGA